MHQLKTALVSLRRQPIPGMRNAAVFGGVLAAASLALATDPTTAEEGITAAKTAILAIIGVGGLAMVLLSLATVGWRVGAKFIKRLAGSA